MENEKILIIDDDPGALKSLTRVLKRKGYGITTAASGEEALALLKEKPFDLVLTDLLLKQMDGLEVLSAVKKIDPEMEVIVITGHASIETAIEAMKNDAFHYLEKPFRPDVVRHLVGQALRKHRLNREVRHLKEQVVPPSLKIIGHGPKILAVKRLIRHAAESNANVLITGESGTGKELAASAVHRFSDRSDMKFLAVNCASFTEDLLSNELFGHEKEAFTGATAARAGLLESASGGTIFFDEIGDMPLSMQARLLRVIQERELIRVGGTRSIRVDLRIIAATNKDLKRRMVAGRFREDLFYRLNVVSIHMPPLAEIKEDIPLLVNHFLDLSNQTSRRKVLGFSKAAMNLLRSYDFPGNSRELQNVVERATALCRSDQVEVEDLPEDLQKIDIFSIQKDACTRKPLRQMEQDYIQLVLRECQNNKSRAAQILGIDRVSLYRKLKKTQLKD